MHPAIQVSHEHERGCGWRKVGGLYLVGTNLIANCGRLPAPLTSCPCCGQGFKPSRGWTWVDGATVLKDAPDCAYRRRPGICATCAVARISKTGERVGLLWVGEMHYPTPRDFLAEAHELGLSRRVPALPKGFEVGKTFVLLAHRHAVPPTGKPVFGKPKSAEGGPGIFCVYRPARVEVIVTGNEPDSLVEAYVRRGLTPVKVERGEFET